MDVSLYQRPPRGGVWTLRGWLVAPLTIHLAPLGGSRYHDVFRWHAGIRHTVLLCVQVDTWCCASWCYVDKECPSAIASLNAGMEGILFWSDNVCVDDPKVMLQCPYKPQPNVSDTDTSCDCLNETMPSVYITIMGLDDTYANYGQQCAPHDADICDIVFPFADHAMWCCTSWCWVSSECARGYPSTLWLGHYWSSSKCDLNAEAISACKYDSSCECRGQLPAGTFDGQDFAADYGSSCKAWDSVDCKVVWGSDADSSWNNSADHEAWLRWR